MNNLPLELYKEIIKHLTINDLITFIRLNNNYYYKLINDINEYIYCIASKS